MNVTREVILDLLPVYLSGEASPATKALVEEFLRGDPELERKVRLESARSLSDILPTALPPELELRALGRTRSVLALLRWLFAAAVTFTLVSFSFQISFQNGSVSEAHFLMRDLPGLMSATLCIGLSSWIVYFVIRRKLRSHG